MTRYEPIAGEDGVLFAWIDGVGRPAMGLTIDEIEAQWKGRAWSWLHLDGNRASTRAWIESAAGGDEEVRSVMLAETTRPRCEANEHRVLFVGRGVNLNPDSQPEDMVAVRAWLTSDRLVTVVLRRVKACEDVAASLGAGTQAPASARAALAMINRKLCDRLGPTITVLNDELDDLTAKVIDEGIEVTTQELVPLRTRAIVLNRYLSPLSLEMRELAEVECGWVDEAFRASTRDTSDRLTRVSEDLLAIQARAALARDEIVSQASERLNKRVYALTVIAVIFLPLSVLTGALGMNVGGVPLAEQGYGFALAVVLFVVIAVLEWLVLRALRWL